LDFRVMTPVSVRTPDERGALGNRVSAWTVPLPVGEPDPRRRLALIQETTGRLKQEKNALGAEMLTRMAGWAPATLLSLGARLACGRAGACAAALLLVRPILLAPGSRLRRPVLEMLGGAIRADPVREHRVRPLRHVLLDGHPLVVVLADVLAVGANGEQSLQLLHLRLEPEDAFRDAQARAQLLRVDGLGNEVVGPRLERLEVPLLPAPRRHHQHVHVAGVLAAADVPAQLEAVH